MLGDRGVGSAWEAVKWIPRFLLLTLCLIIVIYIFSVLISVDYDARSLHAESSLALFAFTDAFSHPDDPSAISYEKFSEATLTDIYPLMEQPDPDDEEVLVRELRFAPVSARLTLTSMDELLEESEIPFEKITLSYEEESFDALRELYIDRERSAIRYARSENVVRVVLDDSARTVLGRLTIEVLI